MVFLYICFENKDEMKLKYSRKCFNQCLFNFYLYEQLPSNEIIPNLQNQDYNDSVVPEINYKTEIFFSSTIEGLQSRYFCVLKILQIVHFGIPIYRSAVGMNIEGFLSKLCSRRQRYNFQLKAFQSIVVFISFY